MVMHNSAEIMLSSRQLGMKVYAKVAITIVLQDEICHQKIYFPSSEHSQAKLAFPNESTIRLTI
jgi:hypothetical protein